MLPPDWIEHRRPGDREPIGWIRPDGEQWVTVSLLGHDLTGPVEWTDGEEALDRTGLAWLSGTWVLDRPDAVAVPVRIVDVTPAGVVVQTDDLGAIDAPVERWSLPWPAPAELRPRRDGDPHAIDGLARRTAIRYPRPLRPGDVVGVTAPSAGVEQPLHARLEHAADVVRRRGYEVRTGQTPYDGGIASAPAGTRATELTTMLTDPAVRAVVPPWGGAFASDILADLDWDALGADPTWLVGFSDLSTLLLPLTLRTGVATLHGQNLMDTPYAPPGGVAHWLDVVTLPAGATFTQRSPRRFRSDGWDDYAAHPDVSTWTLDTPGGWVRLDDSAAPGAEVDVTGRLIGGCLETVVQLKGTPYGDVPGFAAAHADDGLIVYIDISDWNAEDAHRGFRGLRLSGWFDAARAVLVSRARSAAVLGHTLHDAIRETLGDLGVPVLADVECGHVPPYLVLVNGALARVQHGPAESVITQTLA
jgi:muramoyltetrapeptide carboxypeptidase LdcA involved in peptidoglycan recycling